ncbi:hypothetical protein P3339_19750 [Microbulbifer sp. MLAF003]|uniref:hypothetical protein n=1 Tax=Microbulbifer TaxID=48073 RepID=UPI00039E4AAF|nr:MULTISPECIES: hypothetical protein [Microbulbifer]WHI50641.1 hypothetical protein P3339_19750 [Microbulbifer sp. MLAF003]
MTAIATVAAIETENWQRALMALLAVAIVSVGSYSRPSLRSIRQRRAEYASQYTGNDLFEALSELSSAFS